MLCCCPLADALLIFLETGSCFQPGQQSETLSQKQNKTNNKKWAGGAGCRPFRLWWVGRSRGAGVQLYSTKKGWILRGKGGTEA
nr:RecName: Full=Putative uncharacterized protein C1orf134; Flags: Precursor [Homo sapiens]